MQCEFICKDNEKMKSCISCKDYFKESVEVRNAIISGVNALYARICSYEQQNISFDRIFNDDKVKYDKHGQFYTFKFQKSNMQLRILYAYLIIDGVPVVLVADFFVKKRNTKDYIGRFEAVCDKSPEELYGCSRVIGVA